MKVKKILITVVLSIFAGVFSSFFYNVAYKNIPYGLVLSLLLIFSFSMFIKLNYAKLQLSIFSVLLILQIVLFAGFGPFGDDLIIMGNIIGIIFVFAGSLIGPILLFLK
jgi:hypothetical protein